MATPRKAPEDRLPLGRPSTYKPEYAKTAFGFALLGATNDRMAELFGVAPSTFHLWLKEFPDLSESVKAGRDEADAVVVQSLYKRATGYVAKKTVTATFEGVVSDVRVVDEHVAPDTTAIQFWLKNRQPKQWRDKQELDVKMSATVEALRALRTATPEPAETLPDGEA
jgi:hypothetical protein